MGCCYNNANMLALILIRYLFKSEQEILISGAFSAPFFKASGVKWTRTPRHRRLPFQHLHLLTVESKMTSTSPLRTARGRENSYVWAHAQRPSTNLGSDFAGIEPLCRTDVAPGLHIGPQKVYTELPAKPLVFFPSSALLQNPAFIWHLKHSLMNR